MKSSIFVFLIVFSWVCILLPPGTGTGIARGADVNGDVKTVCSHARRPSEYVERILKTKARKVSSQLKGRSIFLVGMMGSGKSTIGKILAEALGYIFVDSDDLLEKVVGASVAQIFNQSNERFFRDIETDILWQLTLSRRLVIATGGGAVVRSINWVYMRRGVSVYIDVPLHVLAMRIASVGTDSRPLLQSKSGLGDAYATAFARVSTLLEERAEEYAKADATVSLQNIAAKTCVDVFEVTPIEVAMEVLEQISGNGESRRGEVPLFFIIFWTYFFWWGMRYLLQAAGWIHP